MALSFDYAARRIAVPPGQAALDVGSLYDECKAAQATERGILQPPIAAGAGRFDLGAGRTSGLFVRLLDNWQVAFPAGAGQVGIDGGVLLGGIAGQPIAYAADTQPILNRPADAFAVATAGGIAPTAAENAAAVMGALVESGLTLQQALRLFAAVLANDASGMGSASEQFKSRDGAKVRLTSSVDAGGNRSVSLGDLG